MAHRMVPPSRRCRGAGSAGEAGLLAATLLFGATLLAGCLSEGEKDPVVTPPPAPVLPSLEDALAALAAGNTTSNVERLGAFGDGLGQEIDAWGDFLAVMQGPKLRILNVTNVSDPQLVGELTLSQVKDVKWSDDGEWIFVANQEQLSGGFGQLGNPDVNVPSVGGVVGPYGNGGIYVVDAHDKAKPELKSFLEIGPRRGAHMVFYYQAPDGTEWVFGANADISISKFDRAKGELTLVSRYSPNVLNDWNRDPEVVDAYYQGWAHDMFVMFDPVVNKSLMYVANWDAGLRIVDVTDPLYWQELGKWMDYPEGHSGNLHTVSTMWIGDRRITVGSPELGFSIVGGTHYVAGDELTGVYVWDTTDPASIQLLSYWSNPREECRFAGRDLPGPLAETLTSSHNVQIEDGRVYLAHYGCGVWVLDVSTSENQTAPVLLGYDDEGLDDVWDVILHRGVMWFSDVSGVFAGHFLTDVIGPDGLSSRA